jgi:DNA repair photolyase
MQTIPAKTLLSARSPGNGWFGNNYNLILYRGCTHGCIYCDSRSDCYRVGVFEEVKVKENALVLLEKELISKRRSGIIGTGAMSDPYNPHERELELTRGALELIERRRFGVGIATKSPLVVRDADLLLGISVNAPAYVKVTVTAFDDELCKKIEPHVAPSSERFAAVRALSSAGILTGILLMPVLPFLCDNEENILRIVDEAHRCGARFIYPGFGMTLRDSQRAYGNRYNCISPHVKALWDSFALRCREHGLLYKMPDIITLIRGLDPLEQLKLF